MLKYMRIPSTARTRDPERSRFFHKLSGLVVDFLGCEAGHTITLDGVRRLAAFLASALGR